MRGANPQSLTNALRVDVEDYFQVSAFEDSIARSEWRHMPRRVEGNTERILDLLAEKGARGTFFILGWVAERHPDLVRRIAAAGHEVASHGFEHSRVSEQTSEQFRRDVGRSRRLLEDIAGVPVKGYRAPSFSIGRSQGWAFGVLAEEGYRYSSSVNPVPHDLYGMPDAPRLPFRPCGEILEIPVSTVALGSRNSPCGGGGYFRLLPYGYFRWGLRRIHRCDRHPCVFYIHPWEIDPGQPRQKGLGWRARFRHYTNLHATEPRLRRLLGDFHWDRMDHVFALEEG